MPLPETKIVCLARAPQFGKVKTRLAKQIGELRALEIYHELLAANAKLLRACAEDMTAEVTVAGVWPPEEFQRTFGDILRSEQPKGDLGEKMKALISAGLAEGHKSVILIGSDCPLLSHAVVRQAAEELSRVDIVIGPADDGGYYLIGMRRDIPELFEGIEWGKPNVLDATLERIAALKLSYHLLKPLFDVDYVADWEQYQKLK